MFVDQLLFATMSSSRRVLQPDMLLTISLGKSSCDAKPGRLLRAARTGLFIVAGGGTSAIKGARTSAFPGQERNDASQNHRLRASLPGKEVSATKIFVDSTKAFVVYS